VERALKTRLKRRALPFKDTNRKERYYECPISENNGFFFGLAFFVQLCGLGQG
jgi:hypothetical protein